MLMWVDEYVMLNGSWEMFGKEHMSIISSKRVIFIYSFEFFHKVKLARFDETILKWSKMQLKCERKNRSIDLVIIYHFMKRNFFKQQQF